MCFLVLFILVSPLPLPAPYRLFLLFVSLSSVFRIRDSKNGETRGFSERRVAKCARSTRMSRNCCVPRQIDRNGARGMQQVKTWGYQ